MSGVAPADAIDLLAELMDLVSAAREAGWTVNLAIESAADAERFTFSAAKAPPP